MNRFHAAVAQALFAPEVADAAPLHDVVAHPAFAVYRNTVMKGCIDALEANFPAVVRLAGNDWFRSAAAEYVRMQPPRDARMLVYGDDGFDSFLQGLDSVSALPYLADVARLDTYWRAAHVAADAPVLQASVLAADLPDALVARVLVPHPAARWAWFREAPVASIWARNRYACRDEDAIRWAAEGVLLTRPHGAVQWEPLSCAGCALLDGCAEGVPLGEAAERALAVDAETELCALLAQLLRAGAFAEGEQHAGKE